MLAAKSEDDSQQSGNLDKGGENLYYGIGNIWTAASQDASVTKTTQGKQQKQTNTTTSLKDQVMTMFNWQLFAKVRETLIVIIEK